MNGPRLVDTPGGVSLEYRGRYLYSRQDPHKSPRRIAAEYPLRANSLYLVPAPLLGYGLSTLLERMPADSLVLCVEADPELYRISREALNAASFHADPRLLLLDTTDAEKVYTRLAERPDWPFRRIELIRLNGGYALSRKIYDLLRDRLDSHIRLSYQDRITKVYLARRWLKNLFTNLGTPFLIENFRALTIDKPVVVLGAGESLEDSLSAIIEKRHNLYLIAADTALPILSSAGIVPDAAVVLEAQFINLRDFYFSPLEQIDLIADLTSYPAVFRLPWRRRFAFLSRFAPLNTLTRLFNGPLTGFEFEAYGSVGIAAAALARTLSSQAVYLSGIDFCYRLGKSHARGNQFHLSELSRSFRFSPPGELSRFFQRPLVRLQGKRAKVVSDLILLNYRESFLEFARRANMLFDLNPAGLDLGLPVRGLGRVEEEGGTAQIGDHPRSGLVRTTSVQFLRREDEYLELLMLEGRNYLGDGENPGPAFDALPEHDYLYAHFPEGYKSYPLDPTAMKRLLIAAEGYRAHFRSILSD